jgi:endonuclease/exonuclease/phosphatase family metal-dependent hydrolase
MHREFFGKDGKMIRRAILLVIGLVLTNLTPAAAQQNFCPVPSELGTLNVLTLNLLFSEYPRRSERLNAVADFVAHNNIQLIALQEVVGGRLDDLVAQRLRGTRVDGNTARELRNLLRQRGVECDLRTGFATGVPALYEVSNATLVCGCRFTGNRIVRLLTPANERIELAGISIRLTRSVLMTRRDTESGSLNIYNTHLCSLCSQEERLRQASEAVSFIAQVESFVPADHVIFLGDFNNVMAEPVYALVTPCRHMKSGDCSKSRWDAITSRISAGPWVFPRSHVTVRWHLTRQLLRASSG